MVANRLQEEERVKDTGNNRDIKEGFMCWGETKDTKLYSEREISGSDIP